jgi:hypothetical protein
MITINEKGSVQQRVSLQKRGRGGIQHTMLNEILINKSENYHVQCGRFLTNNIPALMQNVRSLCKIRPRYPEGQMLSGNQQFDGYDFPQQNVLHKHYHRVYDFQPTVFSVAALCETFAQFIRKFNFVINIWGANHGNWGINNPNVIPRNAIITNLNGFEPYDLGTYVHANQLETWVSTGFEADGAVRLYLSAEFLSNFFIEFDPVFARLIGFPPHIYSSYTLGGVQLISTQTSEPLIELDFQGDEVFNIPIGAAEEINITSTKSIYLFDERLSIDIEITLPISQSIDVLNGAEKHTFILSRFLITDYKDLECVTEQRGGVILSKSILSDRIGSGMVDLVQGKPTSHTAQLLNGKIQVLDMRLVLRYKDYYFQNNNLQYNVLHKTLELEDAGLYDILLQFNKKV